MTIKERDQQRLSLIVPGLRDVIATTLDAMERLGFPMTVTAGARTAEEQFALYQKGRRKDEGGSWVPIMPNRAGIVTNADGYDNRSNHQTKADGFGHAVDCVFLIDGPDRDGELDTPSWDEAHPWSLYGEMVEALGRRKVTWGGRWKTLKDLPHVEWVS